MLPGPVIDHVTAVLSALLTVAVNCFLWEAYTLAVAGARVIETGTRRILAAADLVGSVWLVAVTVTVC